MTDTDPSEQPAAPVCAATRCSHEQAPGALLCALDVRRLGDMLAQLGTEYELLSAVPSMQGREVGTIGGSKLASQRDVGSTHVMALRDPRRGTGWVGCDDPEPDPWGFDDTPSVLGTLASYADQVREGRELTEDVTYVAACLFPCMHRACVLGMGHAVRVPLTVERERRLLAEKNNFRWLLLQDWAGEFFDDIHSLWAALRSANGHAAGGQRVRRLHTPCGSCQVRAVTHRAGDQQAVCENCGTTTVLDAAKMSA